VQQPKKGGFDKINQAYADGGPQRSELVVQQALGTPPFDYYFVLRLDATKNIINAIGGLDVPVDKDMDYDDNWGHLHIHLKKGVQHLNGEQTVGYIRFRHDEESDFGRMRRQREVVQLLARRMKEPGMAARVPALLAVLRDNVRTDMPPDKLFNLALAMRKLAPGKVHSAQLPADVGTVGDASVLFPQAQQTRALVARYLIAGFGKAFDPSTVHVRVENGSGTPGAASALAQYLRQRGFTIVGTGNGKTFANRTTKITGVDQSVVAEVAKRLPIHGVKTAVGPVLGGDVDILIGRDYRTQ
jgi:LCP family protein required for cell wall assembly